MSLDAARAIVVVAGNSVRAGNDLTRKRIILQNGRGPRAEMITTGKCLRIDDVYCFYFVFFSKYFFVGIQNNIARRRTAFSKTHI